MSGIIDIATALTALLTTGKTAGWFAGLPTIGTIERRWAPDWEIADVASLRIGVIPQAQDLREKITRVRDTIDPVVTIALVRHLQNPDNLSTAATVDPYANLAIRIGEIIATGTLPAPAAAAKLISLRHEPLVDQERLLSMRSFYSIITTTWRITQDARVPLPAVP